jgi:uncharacterized protein YciI
MNKGEPMHIIFLRFGPDRALAGQWMAGHKEWIQQGIDDGVFLMAGSLDASQGGVVLATGLAPEEIQRRVDEDPFVIHGVVSAEVHRVTPSRMTGGMAALLEGRAAA